MNWSQESILDKSLEHDFPNHCLYPIVFKYLRMIIYAEYVKHAV